MRVAPSTDPTNNIYELIEYAKILQENDADLLHCDVMDGEFVEKKSINYEDVKKINEKCLLPLDVHLMVKEPAKDIPKYIEAGANIITVHYEAFDDENKLLQTLKMIKKNKTLAGISIKPSTPVKAIFKFLAIVDLVLIMSVEPGKSGQKFLNETYAKIEELNHYKELYNLGFLIEVDGGVNPEIAHNLGRSGVDIVVSGSYIYIALDKRKSINKLRNFVDLNNDAVVE